ncbi:MAG: hypothetical protein CVU44_07870 [Chloroflexi bacterium HGW-Chloroflexi-6]|nr:MAG: hypothetical protein CVU44_07870 [Chloroflexi bacterium HGW-Chloroflexi-6]
MNRTKRLSRKANNIEKRPHLFDLYARNLEAVKKHPQIHIEPNIDDVFVCPLCFCYFTREEAFADGENSLVTIEHIPPEALGGKGRTLTCRSCNSWAGHELDSHLVHSLEVGDFLAGVQGSAVDTKLKFDDDINLIGTAQHTSDQVIELRYDPRRSDPKELEKLSRFEENVPQSINLSFKGGRGRVFKQRRSECSLLRVAYLWAFSVFGYGFLVNSSMSVIRGQIKHPMENVLPHWGISQRPDFPDQSLGINIINFPRELQSFLVVFDVYTRLRPIRFGVILPGPNLPGLHIYEYLKANSASNELPIRFTPIPKSRDYLENPDSCFASSYIWKDWRDL